jgi:hypothetical protein
MLGFRKDKNGKWSVTFTDIFDEVDAWNAQLRQATDRDLAQGNVRGFQQAKSKTSFLMNHGYGRYRGTEGATRMINAPHVKGFTPGAVRHTNAWFYRVP